MCVGFQLRDLKFQDPFKTMEEMALFKKCSFSIKTTEHSNWLYFRHSKCNDGFVEHKLLKLRYYKQYNIVQITIVMDAKSFTQFYKEIIRLPVSSVFLAIKIFSNLRVTVT